METRDEPPRRSGDVDRYERLRSSALGGEPSGWRLGLALLERRGLIAWARAFESTPAPNGAPSGSPPPLPAEGDAIVGALANMALACVDGG